MSKLNPMQAERRKQNSRVEINTEWEKNQFNKSRFFEGINKTGKPLPKLTKKKQKQKSPPSHT